MALVNAKEITKKAFENQYAIPHININNLEWLKAILTSAQENKSPVILGTSEGAIKYMGGFKTIYGMVSGMIEYFNITVPIVLHLDHGSFEMAKKALNNGYTSIMYDGSHLPFDENLKNSQIIIEKARISNASVEVEVGTIGGEEDGILGKGDFADPEEVRKIAKLGPDMIAAGIGNIHGLYPKTWTSLNFEILEKLKSVANRCIVLHGGSGIPSDQVKKSIAMGVAKVNVNTELQIENAVAIRKFVKSGKSEEGKNYDPRKFLAPGYEAMKKIIKIKMEEFGSINKA